MKETRRPIVIRPLKLEPGSREYARFMRILAEVDRLFKPVTDPIQEGQQLSARDFSKTINCTN